ncbi:3-deoxy-D-manno-octulosonic acid transferase [Ulvibacterium marinum]|uniref:3-deoxy-D-manno-octulosonic acid transferase n=1 Tax=Ulvibacterium marinum TaxID=2419782 RepID=A0A3B0CBH2_9FLAO|nr:glycosyltransferase N-terminal domain-containing protein [Ulvibacterium marinum]RKN80326.1 3-deoxy-D-manno-octulosonic acid transferase [Ulvibacterium marinum]
MYLLYTFAVHIAWFFLRLTEIFHPKIKLFVEGRKRTFDILEKSISKQDKIIWMHVASLGEFEQGLPILKQLKLEYPDFKILVTFFSPSGYEVKKNTAAADMVTYLPMDTQKNAKRFLQTVNPKLVLFVKYEIWPNYLKLLAKKEIPTLLISAIFKKEKIYFKAYGGFMRKALKTFTHFFVQDAHSKSLLESLNFYNVTVSGDTRFDRVSEILKQDNHLSFLVDFKGSDLCFIGGSTWPEDEEIITEFINTSQKPMKYVLAPHNIKENHIHSLKKSFQKKVVLYSETAGKDLSGFEVLIVDTIGLLTKIYSYADIAYVGGGFATGLHNTLEPAVFGTPVIIGPQYEGFNEAEELVDRGGILVVKNSLEFSNMLNSLLKDKDYLQNTGQINATYVAEKKGAGVQIMHYIRTLL